MTTLLDALRHRWWLVVTAPVATGVLALLFVLMVRPVFEATTSIRFTEDQSPFGGAVASALGEGGGGLSLLAGLAGRSVPVQTEMAVLGSRSLAELVTDELGLRLELREPARVARGSLFAEVRTNRSALEGEYELRRTGDAFRLRGEVLTRRDPFRPFLNETRREVDLGEVRPGSPLPIEGARIVLAPSALDHGTVEFRILPVSDALDRVQERVVVSKPQRDADLVQITAEWSDPEVATALSSLLTRRFLERREAMQAADFGRTAGFLAAQLDSLRGELENAEESLRGYREAEGIVEPEAQATAAVEQLAELQARRDLLAAERQALLRLLEEIQRGEATPSTSGESPYRRLVFFPTLLQNTATAELLRLLGELENERAALYDRRTPDAREVRVLTERIQGLEGQLRTVAETYLEGLQNQVASLTETLEGFEALLQRVPAVELQYLRRRRQVEVLTELYVFMQMRQKEAEVTAAGEAGGVRVVDEAVVPIEPVRPKPALTLGLSLVVGLILGVAGAVVLEHARPAESAV